MLPRVALAICFLAGGSAPVLANDFAIGAGAGTLGMALQAKFPLSDTLGVRANLNRFSQSVDNDFGEISYAGDIELNTLGVLTDWHPFRGGFRLSGGFMINNNSINGTGTPNPGESFRIGDTDYGNLDIAANAKVSFSKFSPYLGLGFDTIKPGRRGLSFTADLGVMFQGTPDLDFAVVGADAAQVDQNDIRREIVDIESDLADFKLWPVLSLGLIYQF
ncbi:MAG: hypothetical protein ACFCUG_00530 [Thiotrichales bacterium]